jgi:hypothetical protein
VGKSKTEGWGGMEGGRWNGEGTEKMNIEHRTSNIEC